jgi:hypothetical protein
MKAIQLVHDTSYNSLKKVIANFGHSDSGRGLSFDGHKYLFDAKQKIESLLNRQLTYRSVFDYLFNALAEGLKQNLFGPNVNMEFLTLTIQAWSVALIKQATTTFPSYFKNSF